MTEAEEEIKQYLQLLLEHSRECKEERCPSDVLLREICGMIRERIFLGPPAPTANAGPPPEESQSGKERKTVRVDAVGRQA